MFHFLSENHDENPNMELNKTKNTLNFCRKSLGCVAGILAVTNDNV